MIKDLIKYMRERRKFWLIPVIITLLLIALVIVIGANSALAPYIYTLF